jgi:hypothetical protein
VSTSRIISENVIMASFDDVLEEVHKAFEERKKAQEEKDMQELLACYMKDHGSIMQIKKPILPPINPTKEVHTTKVSHPSTSVTLKDVFAMFSEHVKFTRNMLGEEIPKGLAKFS